MAPSVIWRGRGLWERLEQGFWFVPSLVAIPIGLLGVVLAESDRFLGTTQGGVVFSGGPEAARLVLSTIAGSLVTIAGLTFSLLIITLQLVSAQFTPRLLRSFLSDRLNQIVAGAFVGIFLYCLLVLRTVRSEGEGPGREAFVPALAISVAIALGLIGLALLLVFIHHVARSITVATIVARTGRDTSRELQRPYPDSGEPVVLEPATLLGSWDALRESRTIGVGRSGYVARIDLDGVAGSVSGHSDAVHMLVAPGRHVTERTPLARLWPVADAGDCGARIRGCVVVASERSIGQDALFGVRQLADVALRAVSPGLNDPTTAVNCVVRLQDVLETLAIRQSPTPVRRFSEHGVTIVATVPEFRDYLETAFLELAHHASRDPRVMGMVMQALAAVSRAVVEDGPAEEIEARLATIEDFSGRIRRLAPAALNEHADRAADHRHAHVD